MQDYQWPNSFWSEFINKHWQKTPYLFECPSIKPFISLQELFYVVTNMPSYTQSDRFWIVRNAPPKSMTDFRMGMLTLLGPQKNDQDFDGYFNRLNKHTAGINIHQLGSVMPILRERINGFITNLSTVKGVAPTKRWGLDTFFGTYHATPFGIHRDNASVFSFILKGERTYATWPAEYFRPDNDAIQTPDMEKISAHLPFAETFTVKAGDVFYWPSNRWHVALSNGEPSVVAQVSAYFDKGDLDHWQSNNEAKHER